ncbi:MAG: hypothetical protein ACT4N8_07570 [Sphingosinicella sp.]|uniref:hypothetical protein n=1 Tax=Sphingosinicella sp. TaxID=1917971 RepID=UPI00403822B0
MTAARQLILPALLVLSSSSVAALVSSAQGEERQARPGTRSVVQIDPENRVDGPLFNRMRAAFAAANEGDGRAFNRFVAPDANLALLWFSGTEIQRAPLSAETIRAATASCIGPISYDEGPNWVQLSWVCRVDGVGPLASIITFRDSPELSLTAWFENGLITRLEAMEPLSIPGWPRLRMNAFNAIQADPSAFARYRQPIRAPGS